MNSAEHPRNPKVAVIIVIWNGESDTVECLRSLQNDRYPNKEIVVVDNGSTDSSVTTIRTQFPEVTILQAGENLGFTGGNNMGIRHALAHEADYVYLLNNDTTVEPDALCELVNAAEAQPRYGLLTPVIHYYDTPGEIWFSDSRIDLRRGIAVHDHTRVISLSDDPFEIPWSSGCAMFVRADVIRALSGFDVRYYLTWEDVDLSLRVREAGHAVVSVPRARIYHKCGRSGARMSPAKHYYAVRNSLLIARKHIGWGYLPAAFTIVISFIRCSLRSGDRNTVCGFLASVFQGVRDHLLGVYGRRPEASK